MSKGDHADRIGHKNKHCGKVVVHFEVVEEHAAQNHGHFHLQNVEEQVYNPVGAEVHTRDDLHVLEIRLPFIHHTTDNKTWQETQAD